MTVNQLEAYRWSSYWYLFNKRARPSFLDCSGALEAAGGLTDTPKGRRQYLNYLKWLSGDDAAQREMAFEKMCRGWALGTKDFKKALLEEVEAEEKNDDKADVFTPVLRYDGESLREANELRASYGVSPRIHNQCRPFKRGLGGSGGQPMGSEFHVFAGILKGGRFDFRFVVGHGVIWG